MSKVLQYQILSVLSLLEGCQHDHFINRKQAEFGLQTNVCTLIYEIQNSLMSRDPIHHSGLPQ